MKTETQRTEELGTLESLSERLKARAENAYLEMLCCARKDEALGWEIKVERGEFSRMELDAHSAIAERLGRYRALMEAHILLAEALKGMAQSTPESLTLDHKP